MSCNTIQSHLKSRTYTLQTDRHFILCKYSIPITGNTDIIQPSVLITGLAESLSYKWTFIICLFYLQSHFSVVCHHTYFRWLARAIVATLFCITLHEKNSIVSYLVSQVHPEASRVPDEYDRLPMSAVPVRDPPLRLWHEPAGSGLRHGQHGAHQLVPAVPEWQNPGIHGSLSGTHISVYFMQFLILDTYLEPIQRHIRKAAMRFM